MLPRTLSSRKHAGGKPSKASVQVSANRKDFKGEVEQIKRDEPELSDAAVSPKPMSGKTSPWSSLWTLFS